MSEPNLDGVICSDCVYCKGSSGVAMVPSSSWICRFRPVDRNFQTGAYVWPLCYLKNASGDCKDFKPKEV